MATSCHTTIKLKLKLSTMSGTAASGSGVGSTVGGGAGQALALGGLGGSLEDKDCDLLCPVCFELIEEAYVTRCGHSFCYACIAKSVELHRRCPKCGAALASRDHIFPNFLLNELVAKRRLRQSCTSPPGAAPAEGARLRQLLAAESRHLAMPDVDSMLDVLTRRKRLLEAESAAAHHRLVYEFLAQLLRNRQQQLEQLTREAALVRADMEHVAGVLRDLRAGAAGLAQLHARAGEAGPAGEAVRALRQELADLSHAVSQSAHHDADDGLPLHSVSSVEEEESFAGAGGGAGDALAARWRRLAQHFDDFVQCYFAHRADELYFPGSSGASAAPTPAPVTSATPAPSAPATPAGGAPGASEDHVPQGPPDCRAQSAAAPARGDQRLPEGCGAAEAPPAGSGGSRGLEAFREDLVAFTRYRALRPLATLSYCSDAINYSTIVSTIEFDKDDEFFAIAGVTKRIKVFEFKAVVGDAVDVHYPCAEMACSHKISCVSWNAYHKHVLASSDYEGTVSVWDAHTATRTRALQEHDKRCWSVHFNRCDVRLLASGSDDARVKLWALNAERSVATLEAKFNVCCVRFNPKSSCHLAFGSADHCVHYYDLRAPRAPLAVFRDHRKAVSYVQFLDARSLVSASTDSHLKLWRVDSSRCLRSFTGHANEKNFVGLATDGKYIACGSENNALYVYYSGLSRPLLAYRFDAVRGFLERERRDDEPSDFVSAVCWRRAHDQQVLLAANSQGTIKVLELV
ncbi:E3 ubiquitin-protein ligase COP1-like [Pectinophora gossypiella]|uniref:E3 ubiquitin-protein ligase COP1-like n=1 Tax=Pectinophora gossypiella TaxID=13191 RepID=UPI00214E026E|nr:E3 ubiquitin-protein ligase COP1-like [Pectinophora gossypiella]